MPSNIEKFCQSNLNRNKSKIKKKSIMGIFCFHYHNKLRNFLNRFIKSKRKKLRKKLRPIRNLREDLMLKLANLEDCLKKFIRKIKIRY